MDKGDLPAIEVAGDVNHSNLVTGKRNVSASSFRDMVINPPLEEHSRSLFMLSNGWKELLVERDKEIKQLTVVHQEYEQALFAFFQIIDQGSCPSGDRLNQLLVIAHILRSFRDACLNQSDLRTPITSLKKFLSIAGS
jgi:hypothetical protein